MILDGNKTDDTIRVTGAASLFLSERGFKPVETEVYIAAGWVADVAGVCTPTRTEATKLKFVPRFRPRRWYEHSEQNEAWKAWEAQYASIPYPVTAIVEVKTSRGDFFGDDKFAKPPQANLSYVAMPCGMLKPAEFPPESWGVISCNKDGRISRVERHPVAHQIDTETALSFVLAIAVRRDNHTRYARLREFARAQRMESRERKASSRILDVVRLVKSVTSGSQTLDEALLDSGLRSIPSYVRDEIASLTGAPQ